MLPLPHVAAEDQTRGTSVHRFAGLLQHGLVAGLAAAAEYDYIIVGGGTSGLVVANRLSEDYNVSVAVIEAGGVELYNSNITDTSKYGNAFSTSVDWQYESVPQTFAGNASQVLRAGKALGGTSNINGSSKTTNLNPTFSSDSCIRQE